MEIGKSAVARSDEPDPSEMSIVKIHRHALKRLFADTRGSRTCSEDDGDLERRYSDLKRRRIHLMSEIASKSRQDSVSTVAEDLKRFQRQSQQRQHRTMAQRPGSHSHLIQFLPPADLPAQLHSLRTMRRRLGLHRLAGVSVVACHDEHILGIRLDVCLQGRYVSRHYAFFDLVQMVSIRDQLWNNESEEHSDDAQTTVSRVHVRVVQHTIPDGVPVVAIAERTLGTDGLQRDDNQDLIFDESTVSKIRACIREIHDACYCFAIRMLAHDFLAHHSTEGETGQQKTRGENHDDNKSFSILQLECSKSQLDRFGFRLELRYKQDLCLFQIHLEYEDPFSAIPSCVRVWVISTSNVQHGSDEDENRRLRDPLAAAFREGMVSDAIQKRAFALVWGD